MVKPIKNAVQRLPRRHKYLISGISAFLLILLVWPSEQASASRNTTAPEDIPLLETSPELASSDHPEFPILPVEEAVEHALDIPEPEPEDSFEWLSYNVRSGDSMARIFQRLGFSAQQLHRLTQAEDANLLRRIHPGNTLEIARNEDAELAEMRFNLSRTETLVFTLQDDGNYATSREHKEYEVQIGFAHGEINSSFWNAGIQAGMTPAQIMSLAQVFGWSIDFVLDIRRGDRFSILYEQRYLDGEYAGSGRIVAAEFINQNERFEAVLHDDGDYYNSAGESLKGAFLRAPVDFTRVSSEFNPRRMHPVTGQVRPHNGIDYAAPVGTPVMASGDGRVVASTYNNLNGHYIFIQHGERYMTKYLHLHRRNVRVGDRVRQGQIIGQVGATGRVTGPHLHYEFLVEGTHRNPRTVDLPASEPLPDDELPAFRRVAEQKLAMLEERREQLLAAADSASRDDN